jgi:hypothetical protein
MFFIKPLKLQGVSSMLGLAGGVNGTGQQIQTPSTAAQANTAYGTAQDAITQQQQFLQAVQAQNGLGNQSQVFNQLQGVANGTGPNPAQAQLAQATAANNANQASLMAGQRGSSQNAGLIARQAAMQGGANQQQAAGQAATLQANQSLNALNQMGSLATSQANQQANATNSLNSAAQGEQGQILGGIQGQNNAAAGIAQASMGQQANMVGNIVGGAGSALGLAQGGMVPMMATGGPVTTQLNATTPSAQAAGPKSAVGQMFAQNSGMGGAGQAIGKGLGSAIKSIFAPSSPTVNGSVAQNDQYNANLYGAPSANKGPGSNLDDAFNQASGLNTTDGSAYAAGTQQQADVMPQQGAMADASNDPSQMFASGGKVPVVLSPGEKVLSPQEAQAAKQGKIDPIKAGKTVPGKPKVSGAKNDYANDTHQTTEEPGSLVLPRSVTQSKHPAWAAHKFVMAHMAKGGVIPKKPKSK